MRHALAVGALVCSIAGSCAIASAATRTTASTVAVSPDVAEWTSHLVITSPSHHGSGIGRFTGGILARTSKLAGLLARTALHFLGTPYVFGGTSTSGFDCSGFVQHVYGMAGISLPRTADAQYDAGKPAVGGPHVGDLVFFETYTEGVSHVGVYLGKGEFVHASSSHGVMVSKLSDSYWRARYVGAKRLIAARH
ncbi:MAG TPA: C40 family peptidase [Candidatus Tumulicola sp.]